MRSLKEPHAHLFRPLIPIHVQGISPRWRPLLNPLLELVNQATAGRRLVQVVAGTVTSIPCSPEGLVQPAAPRLSPVSPCVPSPSPTPASLSATLLPPSSPPCSASSLPRAAHPSPPPPSLPGRPPLCDLPVSRSPSPPPPPLPLPIPPPRPLALPYHSSPLRALLPPARRSHPSTPRPRPPATPSLPCHPQLPATSPRVLALPPRTAPSTHTPAPTPPSPPPPPPTTNPWPTPPSSGPPPLRPPPPLPETRARRDTDSWLTVISRQRCARSVMLLSTRRPCTPRPQKQRPPP